MSNVRVTYSGLIAFFVGVVSVATGLVFTLIVTRTLSPEEFGSWALIGNIIVYFLISERIISYWTTRQISRGVEVGKTSLTSSLLFSSGVIPLYLILVFFGLGKDISNFDLLLFGVILLPVFYLSQTLGYINLSHRPQVVSYSVLIFEIIKIPFGLGLVYFLELGLMGAIISVFAAYLIRIIIQIYFARTKLKNKFNFSTLKRWLKLSWIAIYSNFTRLVTTLDVLFYVILTSSSFGIAYYSASLTIASIIIHAGIISQALGPKLLARGDHQFIRENFSLMMYFAIPLLGIAILFSRPGLFALNPLYELFYMIAILISIKTFFLIINQNFQNIFENIEEVDTRENVKFSSLLKSNLFLIPTSRYIVSGMYLISFVIMIFFLSSSDISEGELVYYWALMALGFEIPLLLFLSIKITRNTIFRFPFKDILKYFLATIIFSIFFLLTSEQILNYEISIYEFLPTLLIELFLCVLIYFVITITIDKKTRNLTKSIIKEIKG